MKWFELIRKKLGIAKSKDIFYLTFVLIIGLFVIFIFYATIYQIATKHMFYTSYFHFPILNVQFPYLLILCVLLMYIPMFILLFIGISGIFYKPKPNLKLDFCNRMISVIIPAYNEESVIKNILSDLISQSYTNFEILVIAHNCTDDTAQRAREAGNQKVKIIEYATQNIGKALALNRGLQEAAGEVVAQFDADNRIKDPDFLKKAIVYFEDPMIAGIQSEVVASNPNSSWLSLMIDLEGNIFNEISCFGREVLGLNCFMAGTGAILRKKDLLEIGGWNNSLIEDFELSIRYSLKKKKLCYADNLKTYDEKPATWSDLIRQRRRWVKGYLQLFLENLANFGNFIDYIYRLSPLSIFAWWTSTFLYLFYFFTGQISIWSPGSFLWIGLALIFPILLIYILLKSRRYGRKKIFLFCFFYWFFEFHWLWAGLTSLTVRSWADTKTVHNGDFSVAEGRKIEK